jgi:steroid 5-alpha reductase family enzyme
LFSGSTSVNARWYNDNSNDLVDIGIFLRKKHPNILTENIFLLKEKEYHDEFSEKIIDFFPEIIENISDL